MATERNQDNERLLAKQDLERDKLSRTRQRRMQSYNFTLGLASGLVASCTVVILLFAFHPKSLSKIETAIHRVEEKIDSRVEALIKEASPKLFRALFEGDKQSNSSDGLSCQAMDPDRFDCWPYHFGASEASCQARQCCWDPDPVMAGVPYCFYPDGYTSYVVTHVSNTVSPPGLTATLERQTASPYPNDALRLQLDVTYETENRLRFKIFDPDNQRYEVPLTLNKNSSASRQVDYNVTIQNDPFGILVTRISNGALL